MQDFSSTLPYSRTLQQLSGIACAALFLAACSSGGGDGGGGTSPAAAPSSGVFVDSLVQGLGYKALPSGLTGQTDATGQFPYMKGDKVSFDIYGRPIGGAVAADSVVTVLSVFDATSITDPRVLNLSRLLLTLGGIPAVGSPIRVPSTPPGGFPAKLDFSAPGFDSFFPGLTLVDVATATTHLQANFSTLSVTLAGSGGVTSNPTGLNCGAMCSADFFNGTSVTLIATGAGFTDWSGGCTGRDACVVTLNANTSVTATFTVVPVNANLTVTKAGNGTGTVTSSPPGLDCGATCSAPLVQGAVILTANAANGSTFAGWSNGTENAMNCSGTSTCSIPLTVDSTVTATFTLNAVPVSVTPKIASGSGGGGGAVLCSVSGGTPAQCGDYAVGTQVTMTANPDNVSNFTGWSGGTGNAASCIGTSPCVIDRLTADTSITAFFNRPRLTVVVNGTGTVTSTNITGINCEPTCMAAFDKNTSITLTASGTGFSSWSGGGCSGSLSTCQVSLTADTTVTASFVSTTNGYSYPLRVGPTSRYLVDQTGKPFLLVGDAAWSLFAALSDADADLYLEDRRQRGFTAVIANLIEHQFAANPPADFYGIAPFTGQAFTTPPNDAYFAHVDTIVNSAAAKGIVILLDPLYLGFGCGGQGWCAEAKAATTSQMTAWGQYVGNRYKNFNNIIWMVGGDTDPTPVLDKVQATVNGILSADSHRLFTAHNNVEQMAVTPWSGAAWLTVNNAYTYNPAYQLVLSAYANSPTRPVFLVEAIYENEHGATNPEVRAQSYWTMLSGGFGHVFGNCPIWGFDFADTCALTDWKAQLNSVGSMSMQHFQALFTSRHWHTLVPDTGQTILPVSSFHGTFGGSNYAQAACAADGSSIIAYMPSFLTTYLTTNSLPFTVSGACLNGSTMIAWWYNPSTGVATQIGTYPTTGTQNFTPPSSSDDWVLVLDSTNFSFPPPGQ
jgi:hypothetical protein